MSNLPPNPYNNVTGGPQVNANPAPPAFNSTQQFGQVPLSQLPPGFAGTKRDANSNSPIHASTSAPPNALSNVNNYNQSGSNSPAFNQPGIMPPSYKGLQASPVKPPGSINTSTVPSNMSSTSGSPSPFNANPSPTPYTQNAQLQHQVNDNAPPLIPSSQFNHPLMNGPSNPPMSTYQGAMTNQFPATSTPFSSPSVNRPPSGVVPGGNFSLNQAFGPPLQSGPAPNTTQPNMAFTGSLTSPPRGSPIMQGPSINGPTSPPLGPPGPPSTLSSGALGPPKPLASGLLPASKPGPYLNGPTMSGPPISNQPTSIPGQLVGRSPLSGPQSSALMSGPTMSGPPAYTMTGPQGAMGGPQGLISGPPSGPPLSGPASLPPMSVPSLTRPPTGSPMRGPPSQPHASGAPSLPHMSGPPTMPPMSSPPSLPPMSGPLMNRPPLPGAQPFNGPPRSVPPGPMGPPGSQSFPAQIPSQNTLAQFPPPPQQLQPSMGPPVPGQIPTQALAPRTNIQNRYPQMQQPQAAAAGNNPQMPPQPMGQYPQQYTTQNMTQQMGNMSVTRQGFDQLWGHQTMDLMQCKNILPEYPEEMPEIKLGPAFPDAVNCSPEIFRCTVNRIPESNSLLQKSRLPLGILIHPFKDLNHLPVIQCNTIVRCRSCRTYINPFVYFVDAKRWKCNLCFRVNDLPEEFLFDPVSKSYGDPSRRPEIKSATIEFVAPGEYMLRPPQPAVYLFLLDVSQIARDSGYLQVVCETLRACLDELPGDARTQIGLICFDAHVHYYLMSEGLQRPKEMTVLDIEDIFLPSPESLLVNLGERKELVKELLTVLPQRYSGPGVPTSALGAALQAAYKLMAPTGGRITVFQTCLPNVGPGALLPREDPNARSSKDVAHLSPATDFYKRLALDCSGAQICVDLFLLNSQYSDLATLSGMSKFSGGTVYHIPLYKTSRSWQAEQLNRMFTRYLTRKIGFEAVMRVRATRGISIHTFHGNFFVRSTDLLSLPNVSPDAGFGMQLAIDESLKDLQHVCFQAALLYTSSKGERRIRVHTMSLPVATTLSDVLHSADTQCIIGLLSKMAVDRAQSASLGEAREALMHVAVEALSAHRLAQNLPAGVSTSALHAPHSLRLLPLFLLALLKRKAFRTGTSTRLDDRVADMCALKSQPLSALMRALYPPLYPLHDLAQHCHYTDDEELVPDPPRLHLSAERVNATGAYLLDDGDTMIIYVGRSVSPAFLSETFGVAAFSQIPDEARSLPRVESETSALIHSFIDRLNDDRPYASDILVLRDNSPSKLLFTERLVDDRVESAFSYYEFLQHVKNQVK